MISSVGYGSQFYGSNSFSIQSKASASNAPTPPNQNKPSATTPNAPSSPHVVNNVINNLQQISQNLGSRPSDQNKPLSTILTAAKPVTTADTPSSPHVVDNVMNNLQQISQNLGSRPSDPSKPLDTISTAATTTAVAATQTSDADANVQIVPPPPMTYMSSPASDSNAQIALPRYMFSHI